MKGITAEEIIYALKYMVYEKFIKNQPEPEETQKRGKKRRKNRNIHKRRTEYSSPTELQKMNLGGKKICRKKKGYSLLIIQHLHSQGIARLHHSR